MYEPCSVELLETFGDDLTVVNAARVSLAKHSSEMCSADEKLIKYLMDHDHNSPFFHPQARFRIKIPVFLAREWFRHTVGFARNEVSRRYVDSPPTFFLPEVVRLRAPGKKQGSDESSCYPLGRDMIQSATQTSYAAYLELLEKGVCPEQARLVLPQNMMTEFIETGSLAAYARLCKLRISPDAQKEIRDVAVMVSEHMEQAFPVSWKAFSSSCSS